LIPHAYYNILGRAEASCKVLATLFFSFQDDFLTSRWQGAAHSQIIGIGYESSFSFSKDLRWLDFDSLIKFF
jgi:hypothetical protein